MVTNLQVWPGVPPEIQLIYSAQFLDKMAALMSGGYGILYLLSTSPSQTMLFPGTILR